MLDNTPYIYDRQRFTSQFVREPLPHQKPALDKLRAWYKTAHRTPMGGILVLPTGGGKTFTAERFLCQELLPQGYKVLWLAHTHQLLDQAQHEFSNHAALAFGKKDILRLRVVAGAAGYHPVRSIQTDDDMVIGTLQTLSSALRNEHSALFAWLHAARNKLCVVFDEAHHAPARSYWQLLDTLREICPSLILLGLTATPMRTEEQRMLLTPNGSRKGGALRTIFPQDVLHEITATELMSQGILAKPIFEDVTTNAVPDEEVDVDDLLSHYGDLTEKVVTLLAENRARNDLIVSHYVNNRAKYGKTIIFADRAAQCEYLAAALRAQGIQDIHVVYSHIEGRATAARTSSDNDNSLEAFKRSKHGVLINIRIATEGSDFPDVQTVFLTRQTTSSILLTQMIGRALRGPRVGGTDSAYIVSFMDNWRHLINWAGYGQLVQEGTLPPSPIKMHARPEMMVIPIQLIQELSNELLATQADTQPQVSEYLTLMPTGWYVAEFVTTTLADAEEDDLEPDTSLGSSSDTQRPFVLVFGDEQGCYESLFQAYLTNDLPGIDLFDDDTLTFQYLSAEHETVLDTWMATYFEGVPERSDRDMRANLFHLARHLAENGEVPPFFEFEARIDHDLDDLPRQALLEDWGPHKTRESLLAEYQRDDRYWQALYSSSEAFQKHYYARLLAIQSNTEVPTPVPDGGNAVRSRLDPEVMRSVKKRDDYRCLCCGNNHSLQIDHIYPRYRGDNDDPGNLQTLCARCNTWKEIEEIDFRETRTALKQRPEQLHLPPLRSNDDDPSAWERYLCRTLNFYYQCAAVESVKIGKRGDLFYHWQIELRDGNNPRWLHKGDLHMLLEAMRRVRPALETITIHAPRYQDITVGDRQPLDLPIWGR